MSVGVCEKERERKKEGGQFFVVCTHMNPVPRSSDPRKQFSFYLSAFLETSENAFSRDSNEILFFNQICT